MRIYKKPFTIESVSITFSDGSTLIMNPHVQTVAFNHPRNRVEQGSFDDLEKSLIRAAALNSQSKSKS